MIFLLFNVMMLLLFVMARYRSPEIGLVRGPWFFLGLLPSELPWLFGLCHLLGTVCFGPFKIYSGADFTILSIFSLALALVIIYLWFSLHAKTFQAGPAFERALEEGLGSDFSTDTLDNLPIDAPPVHAQKRWRNPFGFKRDGVERIKNISYGLLPRQRLDLYRPVNIVNADEKREHKILRPVLLHIHGGGWVVGHKHQQAQPLIQYLAGSGWICLDINYRLAPKHRFPACVIDVKTAIAWVKKNIEAYGGDPNFIALTGGSAGGHLSVLAALTPNQKQFQPDFELDNTEVQAVVCMYGVYDFTNTDQNWSGATLSDLLHKRVMPFAHADNPEYWRAASPLHQVNNLAPPIMVVHGTTDCLVFVEDARRFVSALRHVSDKSVVYAELDGAQHAFDLFHGVRTEFAIESVGKFLRFCYVQRQGKKAAI